MITPVAILRTFSIVAVLITTLTGSTGQKKQKNAPKVVSRNMLSGIWIIGKGATEPAQKDKSDDFLPPGLQVQIKLLGPTRLAIEENRSDELGGEITLLPPILNDICSTWFGTQLCKNGAVSNPTRSASFDAVFRFSRWTRKDQEDIDNQFFAEQGAKAGALFVGISFPPTGPEWRLWIESKNRLINTYVFTDASGHKAQAPQSWGRLPDSR